MADLRVEYMKTADLTPYEKNAKQHPEEQIQQIIRSIEMFGMDDPIAVWGPDNTIIEGHGRLMACKRLGMSEVPVIRLDHLTDEQRRAYTLIHNKLTMNSDFDIDILNSELSAIFDIDMEDFGFIEETSTAEATQDDYDSPEKPEPISQPGDLYKLGRHYLLCGDATNREDVTKLLQGIHADLTLTDPPYGINIVNKKGNIGDSCIAAVNTYMEIKNDESTDAARLNYEIISDVSDNQIIFGGNYFSDFLPASSCWLIWDKENNDNNFADCELAWTSFKKAARLYNYAYMDLEDGWTDGSHIYHWLWNGLIRKGNRKTELTKRIHPTQKPVGMLGEILTDFTADGSTILDCFGGSGSVLIACEQLNRTCYMMEFEPYYVDLIIDRWETYTGQKAEKITD